MESLHGVDVSWLHHPTKGCIRIRALTPQAAYSTDRETENLGRSRAVSSPASAPTPVASKNDTRPTTPTATAQTAQVATSQSSQATTTTPLPTPPAKDAPTSQQPTPPTNEQASAKAPPKRPSVLNRGNSKDASSDNVRTSRRTSWMSNISSKFSSSQSQPPPQAQAPSPTARTPPSSTNGSTTAVTRPVQANAQIAQPRGTEPEELQPYIPSKPKDSNSSFLSSLTRRLSSGSQAGGSGKLAESGGVCPRRVLNVDPNRERCKFGEFDPAKLKRVSFSVDVEIAGGPKYKDDEASPDDKQKKTKDKKIKERAEGEALKDPRAATEKKEHDANTAKTNVDEKIVQNDGPVGTAKEPSSPDLTRNGSPEGKKPKTEEERREKKEKRRRKAEESGAAPIELTRDEDDGKQSPTKNGSDKPKSQDKPTTDPVRIYRRCCQLRESPILKRITEQLMSPTCTLPNDPGTVDCLDLSNSKLQEGDFVTLGDWLAVVPVKRLILENADITDEGVRCVLAGLLASKKPQPLKLLRKNSGDPANGKPRQDRLGVVERLVLKNNPRISPIGWKHISCFLYMCRSIKALDLSMVHFPTELPRNTTSEFTRSTAAKNSSASDAATIFSKALAERLGGSTLEELSMSECGLLSHQIQKIVEAAKTCRLERMSFAGNNVDDEGLEHILGYIRSGVCLAVDIGSNDLRGKLGRLATALNETPNCRVWGLSLVNCNLDTETLRELFPALVGLQDFRFIDLSHNKHLFDNDQAGGVHLLRKYIPKMRNLIRLHLMDVGLNTKQAIALAEILPEGPRLAHVNILENEEITGLASKTDENSQEEACALYASLMAAVRVSSTIVCIDVAAPDPKNSEIVKALARQMVAYCLRNMELSPLMTNPEAKANIASELTKPHRESGSSEMTVPEVLMHLVGQVDGLRANHDLDGPSPDNDYFVGGNGVVKALQYCLGEKAQEIRRGSTAVSGYTTPKDKDSAVGNDFENKGKAKETSKYLLETARTIRSKMRPALLREAVSAEALAYKRLLFLDSTLEKMIMRFEEEFPETRQEPGSPKQLAGEESPVGSVGSVEATPFFNTLSDGSPIPGLVRNASMLSDDDDGNSSVMKPRPSRHNSDVNLASRALSLEEGRIHRLGQGIRRDIMNAPSPADSHATAVPNAPGAPATTSAQPTDPHLQDLARKLENISGPELNTILDSGGWTEVMQKVGANMEELRQLQELDPTGWEQFKESQMKARMNVGWRGGAAVE